MSGIIRHFNPTRSIRLLVGTMLVCVVLDSSLRAETMVQYFNTSWKEITNKMPELAEAGYGAIWLPPPTKGSGGLSVGYDMFDPFDLGSKNQRGSVKTRYGTEAELLRLVETAHRFGIRIYFDNIMNHRAFDVPGYNETTPVDLYPGMLPEDFHLRLTTEGFYRKWDNTRSWNDAWQVQQLGLADLIDIAQEPGTTNLNFGKTEGSTWPKIKFIRDYERPEQYCYDKDGNYIGFGGLIAMARQPANLGPSASDAQAKAWAQNYLTTNKSKYEEYVQDYLNRAARWLIDRTKADGLRLDAVKHVHADFFGATFGADKDSSDYGYSGQVQRQFNITRGFSDANHRDSVFNTEAGRDDAMLFGEHLGEPPAYGPYIDAGMRLVDNVLRNNLNSKLGNPSDGLNGYDQPGAGGFAASVGVAHAQSHDNDYAARRELQHAMYFTREGMGLIYTDGNYQAETLGESGGAFPRHANTAFLGQFGDGRVPNLTYIHDQFARGYQVGKWSDADFIAYERIDKRENGAMADSDGVTMLFMINDNYASGQARTFNTSFPAGAYLYNYSWVGGGFYKFKEELNTVVVPSGGYFIFSWKNPDPALGWRNGGGRPITITQGGVECPTVSYVRKDGPNGDKAFNGTTLPDAAKPILPTDTNVTDYKYSATVPRITDGSAVRFIARVDGSAANVLLKLDGGMDLNGTNHALGDPRDNPPAISTDVFQGYEQPTFVSRIHPELFAAVDTGARNVTGSPGAETYTTTTRVNGAGTKLIDGDTAIFLYHDPSAPVGNITPARNQYDASRNQLWAKPNAVGGGYKMFLYYTTDGSNPEGAAGMGAGKTKTAEMNFDHNDDGGTTDWWKCALPGDFTATSKYKIGIYKEGAPPWFPGNAASVDRKQKMQTTFQTTPRNLTTVAHRPHNDYGAIVNGLEEGFHVIRARAFLQRDGQASIYNTFTQTFYYDALPPGGEVAFPTTNGDTVGGSSYGVVVRTDPSVTEVWYNIDDTDPSNDDSVTRVANGNGMGFEPYTDSNKNGNHDSGEPFQDLNENGVWDGSNVNPASGTAITSWVKASEVTPSLNINSSYQKEWRLNYSNIPATGTATIKVRLREVSSAAYKDFALSDAAGHYTTLQRTVNTAGPDYRVFVAYPQTDGDTVDDNYVMKVFFTKSLADGLTTTQLINKFTIRIGANDDTIGTAQARDNFTINYNANANYHELAFPLPNLYNDQPDYLHKIEVTFDRTSPDPDLVTQRIVKAAPSNKPRISIITPPELDSDGKPFEIVLPDKASPSAAERSYVVRVSTGTDATSVTMNVTAGPINFSTPVVTTEGSTKFWDFTWSGMTEGEFRFEARVVSPTGESFDNRRAKVVFRQVVPAAAADPDDDDDGLLDADEGTDTPLPNGYPTDDPKYKPNAEQWTNGEVHIHNAFGKSDPLNPDTDGDGLPDALEVGWRNATIVGESFTDTGYGPNNTGAGDGVFDWNDVNGNGLHDTGEASEPFTDTNGNGRFDFGTILSRDTDGDGVPNFVGDLDPPFYNTLDNLNKVPGVNTASEGGDRSKQLRGGVTDPNDPDSDHDGIADGIEDANHNGWVDGEPWIDSNGNGKWDTGESFTDRNGNGVFNTGDGEPLPVSYNPYLGRNWPNHVQEPGEFWTETDPNNPDTDGDGATDGFGEDKDGNGRIAGDTNNNRIYDSGEFWTETDPLNRDTDGDGLPDGWEVKYGLDPLDNGTLNMRTGLAGNPINGGSGDPDGDGFTNLQELANGTNPKEDNTIPPPPPGSITIGPKSPSIVIGGVTNNQEFTDWTINDLLALDEYDGDGTNNQGSDVYKANDGYDSSRDIVAFYAHDGGSTSLGGDGNFYFRVDLQDLKAHAEDANLDIYVVMDFGSPSVGEYALPDEVDTGTQMRWEAVVACYATDNGAVYVDTNHALNTTAYNQALTGVGVVRRTQANADGFKKAWFNSNLDAVEFSISRQALIDAGWNQDPNNINFQVFTTKDGTQNSPVGAGDIGGRGDIRDTILDDVQASSYWRDQSSLTGDKAVLKSWFSATSTNNDKWKRAKVVSLIHEARPLLPGSEVQALLNNGAGGGWYRPLDVHEAFGVPLAMHITPTLASAIQWAKVDPAVNKPWRDGPSLNSRIGTLATNGIVQFTGTTFADHILPYFPQSYTQASISDASQFMSDVYGSAPSSAVLYPPERVLDTTAMNVIQGCGFTATFADQSRHIEKWFGRASSLGSDGYRINRVNGTKLVVINDSTSAFRFDNNDGGLGLPLRQMLNRRARSSQQDQVVVLHCDWSDFTTKAQADAYDLNIAWMASHPWVQLVTPQQILAGAVDSNRDGVGDTWPVVERGTTTLANVSKDFLHHATQENYDNWFFGQPGLEESLSAKLFNIRPATPMSLPWGQVGVSGVSNTAWSSASALSPTNPLRLLARNTFHASAWLTAFHNQTSNDLTRFSTGAYVYPDTTNQSLAGFSKAAQSQARWAYVYQRVTTWANAATAGTYDSTSGTESADVDLDGEAECMILNKRVFALFERIGGRMTAAWVRDIANGKVFQCVGNPVSYSGFETEEEGAVNVINGAVGSYRTSGFKDWYAGGVNSVGYNNDLYSATATTNGFIFTSSDGKITKTITLQPNKDALRAVYALTGGITTLYSRHGLSPHLAHLLKTGQTNLSALANFSGQIETLTTGADGIVRAYVEPLASTTWNSGAIDDDPGLGVTFDTINMRNQAQTQQIELSGTTGMTFELGFQTGPTLTRDSDGDGLPDSWELANGLNGGDASGANGAAGNPDGDGLNNLSEYILGTNPNAADVYVPGVAKVPAGFTVSFSTIPNRGYKIYYSDDLATWNLLGSEVTGDGTTKTVTDDGTASTPAPNTRPQRFYRVEVRVLNP
ncbi:MAG: hypothetical protein K1X78_24550 [Verrucomicrobiaceae bacterium]|nr:hypothetical protein [Verrucomicrobiaceae bacterium]